MAKKPEIDLEKLVDSEEVKIANLVTATDADGKPFYIYLLQSIRQSIALQHVTAIGATVEFSDFGEIIAQGDGHVPPDDVKKEVEEKYGLDHNFEQNLVEEFNQITAEMEQMKKRGISEKDFFARKIKEASEEITDSFEE